MDRSWTKIVCLNGYRLLDSRAWIGVMTPDAATRRPPCMARKVIPCTFATSTPTHAVFPETPTNHTAENRPIRKREPREREVPEHA